MSAMADSALDFSIIVPTYNRPRQLGECLTALVSLEYSHERFEVVVVDDGGTTPLDDVTASFHGGLGLIVVRSANAGPAAARNLGAAHARGRYLLFTDDDCRPRPNWLRALEARGRSARGALLGGRTLNALPGNRCSALSQLIVDVVYAHYNADPDNARFFASNNLAAPAARFHALGGFDPEFRTAEDRDLCDRWLGDGGRLVYVPDAVVDHAHALTVRGLWRQHFGYGRGAYRFHRSPARRGRNSLRIEGRLYREFVRYPYAHERTARAVSLTLLLVVQQAANAAGFAAEWIESFRRSRVTRAAAGP